MDIKQIKRLLEQTGSSVILDEEGRPAIVALSWSAWLDLTGQTVQEPVQEVPISSRWPKAPRQAVDIQTRQDQVLERLNKEILALKAQIEQEEAAE